MNPYESSRVARPRRRVFQPFRLFLIPCSFVVSVYLWTMVMAGRPFLASAIVATMACWVLLAMRVRRIVKAKSRLPGEDNPG